MKEEATIVLPLPHRSLSPNAPVFSVGGRINQAVQVRRQRKLAKERTEALGIETHPWAKVEVHCAFFHRQKRRRDGVNHLAMLKGAFDGIVDSGLVIDDNSDIWSTMPPTFGTDKDNPRVEITVVNTTTKGG
jgi:hypothetical protein